MRDSINLMPAKFIKLLGVVRFSAQERDPKGNILATAFRSIIEIKSLGFSEFKKDRVIRDFTLKHELAHMVAQYLFGSHEPGKEYLRISSTESSVSTFGDTLVKEDWAEALASFWTQLAGEKLPPDINPHTPYRFQYFKEKQLY